MSIEKFCPWSKGPLEVKSIPYTTLTNDVLQNLRDAEAGFIWCYLQSRPPEWELDPRDLQRHFVLGEKKVYKILTFLIECKLLERIVFRREAGKFSGNKYIVHDGTAFISKRINHLQEVPENQEVVVEPYGSFDQTVHSPYRSYGVAVNGVAVNGGAIQNKDIYKNNKEERKDLTHTKEIEEKNDIEHKNSPNVSVCVDSGLTPAEDEIHTTKPQLKNQPRIAISRKKSGDKVFEKKFEFTQEDVDSGFADFWDEYKSKTGFKRARQAWHWKQLSLKRVEIMADIAEKNAHDRRWAAGYIPDADTYLHDDGWMDEIHLAEGADVKKFKPTALTPDEKVLILEYCSFRSSKHVPKKDLQEKIDALKEKLKSLDSPEARESIAEMEKSEEAFYRRPREAIIAEALAAQNRIAKEKGEDVMRSELKSIHEVLTKPKQQESRYEPSVAAKGALKNLRSTLGMPDGSPEKAQMKGFVANKLTALRESAIAAADDFFTDEAIEV